MVKKLTSMSKASFFLVAIIAGLVVWSQRHYQQCIRDLRAQIKTELQIEQSDMIRQVVRAEVQRVWKDETVRKDSSLSDALVMNTGHHDQIPGETIQDAIRRVVAEIYASDGGQETLHATHVVTDDMLDSAVAGTGIDPDTLIQGGFVKKPAHDPADLLARADGRLEDEVSSHDLDVAGGDGVERPESIERTMQQKGSVLLGKGKRIFEPSFTYAHFSTNRINIQGVTILDVFTIGPVSTQKIKRDMFIHTLGFKYGLMDNLQAEIRIPFRYEFDRITNTDQTAEETRSKGGLGDIDVSLSRQIGWEEGWKPDLIASIGIKSDTGEPIYNNSIGLGTGHWSARGSLVAAKSSDPAVIFGSLSYSHSFEESFNNYGKIQPGDTVGYSLGLAIALSYKTAINFALDQSLTQKLKRGGDYVVGSFVNSANFKTGINWALSDRASVDVSAAMGLTEDSPDFTLEVRVPIYF